MNHFSQQQLNKILSLIREVEKLTDVEKLFLYLHLPCGKSELIEGGKSRPNNRLKSQNSGSPSSLQTISTTTNPNKHQLTSSSSSPAGTSRPSSPIALISPPPATLSDFQKQVEQMPKRPDQETTQTYTWILSHLEVDPNVSLPKQEVYEEYRSFCQMSRFEPLCVADFGKAMKYAFPCIKPRRLGQRGNSRYCYSGLRKKYKLESPTLPSMDIGGGYLDSPQQNLINMDTTTTITTNATTMIDNNKQLTSLISNIDSNINSNSSSNNIVTSCSKQADLSACNGHVLMGASDRVRQMQLQQKTSNNSSPIISGIIPMTSVYSLPTSIAPKTTISSTQYNENNHQYQDTNNADQHQIGTFQQQDPHQSMNQRESSLMTPNNFDGTIYQNQNNPTTSTNDNVGPLGSVGAVSGNYNLTAQDRSTIIQQQHVPSSITSANTAITSSFQPITTTTLIGIRHPVVSQASFDQGTSMVGTTNFNYISPIRPGTPDDDDYCHNYYSQYQYQDNCISSNSNNNMPHQQHHDHRHDQCNENINNTNVISINYASNFRCQQHFQSQQQSHQQQYQSNNNNNSNHHRQGSNIDGNNNQQQYHQRPHQQHPHHVTTPAGSSVNADPALSNGGAGPGYPNDHNDSNHNYKFTNNNTNSNNNSYNNNSNNNDNSNNINTFVPKQEPNDPIIPSFKQNNNHQQQQQLVINQSAIPLSMFTLDSCVSSPFQSPASTPYPSQSHMMIATTPTSYEQTTNEQESFTTRPDSILLSRPASAQNHYMTT